MSAGVPGLRFTRANSPAEPSPLRSDVAGFIGRTRRGPVGRVVRVEGWREYVRVFGALAPGALTPYAVRGYFENGGEVAHVIRIAEPDPKHAHAIWTVTEPSLPANTVVPRPAAFRHASYRVFAESPGTWANAARLAIRYLRRGASGKAELDVTVEVPDEPIAYVRGLDAEALSPADSEQGPLRVGLVSIAGIGPQPALAAALGPQSLTWRLELSSGSDGAGPVKPAYAEAVAVLGEVEEVALVCVPDLHADLTDEDERRHLVTALLAGAESTKDRLVILDPPPHARGAEALAAWADNLPHGDVGGGFRAAAAYHPNLRVRDPFGGITNPLKAVPPSGHVAGVISRVDRERGAHYTPANAPLREAIDITERYGADEHARLYDAGVNLLPCVPGRGLQVWGGRTLAREREFRYIAHRRLIHRLVRAIRRVAAPLVFDTNGPELWLALVRAVTTVLLAAYRAGALKGARPDQAFRVRCDEKTTPLEVSELGQVVCEIEIAPAVPMEFILLRVALGASGELEIFES